MNIEHKRLMYNKYMKYDAIFTPSTSDGRYLDGINKLTCVRKKVREQLGSSQVTNVLLTIDPVTIANDDP